MKKVKVLVVLNSLDMGGIEKTLLSCMPFLEELDVRIDICCYQQGGVLEKRFVERGVTVHHIKKTGSLFFDAFQLRRILSKNKYDLVHSRMSFTSGGFGIACKMSGVPLIVSLHNETAATLASWKHKPVLRSLRGMYLGMHKFFTNVYASKIIGHSKTNLKAWNKNYENLENYRLVYNGVDFKKLNGNKAVKKDSNDLNTIKLVHVGSFKDQKNHLFLLESFKRLNPVLNNYHLTLVGDGGLRGQIENYILKEELAEVVTLTGVVDDIQAYVGASDIFFFPSLYEGLANVLIEAQYLGVPVCASRIGPHHESVYYKYHSYFFDPQSYQEADKSLRRMIDHLQKSELNTTRSEAKQFVINNFSISEMASNLRKVFDEVI